jgi:hypothetical protein
MTPVLANKEKKSLQSLRFLLILGFSLFLPSWAAAERPFLFTESAVPAEKKIYRLETGLALNRFSSKDRQTILDASLRYGLIQNLELNIEVPYLFQENNGDHENQFGDILLKTKIRFIKGREANPLSVAGQMFIKVPSSGKDDFFGTTGKPDIGFIAIASKEFTPVVAHINFGYVFIGNPSFEDKQDHLRYSLGLEVKLEEQVFSVVGEIFGSTEIGSTISNGLLGVLGGIAYRAAEPDILLDLSAGFGMTHDSPDYMINAGLTYSFQ